MSIWALLGLIAAIMFLLVYSVALWMWATFRANPPGGVPVIDVRTGKKVQAGAGIHKQGVLADSTIVQRLKGGFGGREDHVCEGAVLWLKNTSGKVFMGLHPQSVAAKMFGVLDFVTREELLIMTASRDHERAEKEEVLHINEKAFDKKTEKYANLLLKAAKDAKGVQYAKKTH